MQLFTAEERASLNKKLENYLRPIRFRTSMVVPDATDGRTPFDSDFARVALSAPVRRLQDKTQVHPLPQYDFVRNRLTHSLEALCIARGLGLGVEKVLNENGLFEIGKVPTYHHAITSILETAALIHDIGNPPFGHSTETAVQNYFRNIKNPFIAQHFDALTPEQKTDLCNIEGNSQGLRILLHLALAKDKFSYNLTMPTMATIVKYPYSSTAGNKKGVGIPHEQEKFGYLQAEAEDYIKICQELGINPNGQRHPITYLLEAADDIAYGVCDIEDAYKNELIDAEFIQLKYAQSGYHDEAIDACIATLPDEDEVKEQANIQDLRIKMQSKMIVECTKTFCRNYKDIIEGNYKKELLKDSKAAQLKSFCKETMRDVFKDPEIKSKEAEAEKAVHYLLDGFLTAVLFLSPESQEKASESVLYSYISPNYRKVACEEGNNIPTDMYKTFLLVTDYIFGMTDRFLMSKYKDDDIRNMIKDLYNKIGVEQPA